MVHEGLVETPLFFGERRIEDLIVHLLRIGLQVIELVGGQQVDDQLIPPVVDQVDVGDRALIGAASSKAPDQQGDMDDLLIHGRPLLGQRVGIEHVPMVGGVDDHGIRRIAVHRLQHAADLIVHEAVAAQEIGEVHGKVRGCGLHQCLPGPEPLVLRLSRQGVGQVLFAAELGELLVGISGPEPLRAETWVVGLVIGDHQEKVL